MSGEAVPVIDPQAAGWRDDGSESGIIRVDPIAPGIQHMPFEAGRYTAEINGTAAASISATAWDPGGWGVGLNVNVPSGQGNGLRLFVPFVGPLFGIRYRGIATSCPVVVSVDGAPVRVDTAQANTSIALDATPSNNEHGMMVTHRDLSRGMHIAEIVVMSGASTNSILLFGYVVAAGYMVQPNRRASLSSLGAVPLAAAAPSVGSGSQVLGGLERLIYYNGSGSSATVTLSWFDGTVFATMLLADKETRVFDFGSPISGITLLRHVSTAAGVNCFAVARI